jgi:hypothetical protein
MTNQIKDDQSTIFIHVPSFPCSCKTCLSTLGSRISLWIITINYTCFALFNFARPMLCCPVQISQLNGLGISGTMRWALVAKSISVISGQVYNHHITYYNLWVWVKVVVARWTLHQLLNKSAKTPKILSFWFYGFSWFFYVSLTIQLLRFFSHSNEMSCVKHSCGRSWDFFDWCIRSGDGCLINLWSDLFVPDVHVTWNVTSVIL